MFDTNDIELSLEDTLKILFLVIVTIVFFIQFMNNFTMFFFQYCVKGCILFIIDLIVLIVEFIMFIVASLMLFIKGCKMFIRDVMIFIKHFMKGCIGGCIIFIITFIECCKLFIKDIVFLVKNIITFFIHCLEAFCEFGRM